MSKGVLAFSAALVLLVSLQVANSAPTNALSGNYCSPNPKNYFSNICFFAGSGPSWSGVYAEWPSVALNITQAKANAGYWIAQVMWFSNEADGTWLELGDSAGTSKMVDQNTGLPLPNLWERWWYWVDGVGMYAEWGIQQAPSDGVNRAWGIQWEPTYGDWRGYIAGSQKFTKVWRDPNTMSYVSPALGIEIFNGVDEASGNPYPLDSGMNSGLFTATRLLVRDLAGGWYNWPSQNVAVDSPCGSAPTCLQGWQPAANQFNDAKPAQ